MRGQLALVLHAHLPFVRHPEHEQFLEEDWLYEAISETYLPLLDVFDRLDAESVPFRLTMTLSPTLVAMLGDSLLMRRYARRIDALCELSQKEVARTRGDPQFEEVANFYRERFAALRVSFRDRYEGDLIGAFRRLQDSGRLEIITCCATHGFLPLLRTVPSSVRAQVAIGAAAYREAFGRNPPGIWLPECGYYPGVERYLAEQGIAYFFLDTHGIMDAQPRPLYGTYAPLFTESGVAAFGRDPDSSQQVWSKEDGYPGDPMYREFYRDIGWDLDIRYIGSYVQATGDRKNTGIKYYRITGDTDRKEIYQPSVALARAQIDAADFVLQRRRQIEAVGAQMDRPPLIVAPYDAELFGHWWFEGPAFLDALIRKSAFDQDTYALVTPTDYLKTYSENQLATPAESSWGEAGHGAMWLDASNDWLYRHLHHCAERMERLAEQFAQPSPLETRALNQAARELLLAQASDWAFILKTGTMASYAERRVKDHVLRFNRLDAQLTSAAVDLAWVEFLERRDNLFPQIDYRVYRSIPSEQGR